jgi:hypothetical protein
MYHAMESSIGSNDTVVDHVDADTPLLDALLPHPPAAEFIRGTKFSAL